MSSLLSSIPWQIYLGVCVAGIGIVIFLVLNQISDHSSARSSLRQLDDFQVVDQREKKLIAPLRSRVLMPAISGFGQMGSRLNPPQYIESVREKHMQAGIFSAEAVEKFLAIRVLGFIFVPIWAFLMLVINPFGLSGKFQLAATVLGGVLGVLAPTVRLDRKVDSRQTEIRQALPDVLDLLVISVEAGLGFEQGVDKVISNVPGPLSDEFSRVLGETRAGSSRADALRNMQDRVDIPEIRSFVLAMIQADTFGVSIGRVLRAQADEMRVKRRQLAHEAAQKAPVKMLLPMVFCIFPALFIVVLGPAAINIIDNF